MYRRLSTSLLFAAACSLGLSHSASAQHCRWRFDQSFNAISGRSLRSLEMPRNAYDTQLKIAAEVDALFGPRQKQCEEGAYSLFMERYERYVTTALRTNGPERELRLRAAIVVIGKSPEIVDYAGASKEVSLYRQTLSNIGAVAHDVGTTPLVQQLLDAIEAVGAPSATQRPASPLPDPHVSMVYVPNVPLPGWAVVSIYEMEDHLRRNENGAAQGKLEAIINWMKTVTPSQPTQ